MLLQIIETVKNETSKGATVIANKKKIHVYFGKNYINVLQENAMNRAWKGCGKCFQTIEQALAAYKSPEMKAAINYTANL